jgi:crotonobetainyl-CoA:carnitine CoA-transferase CaiB-like acyl-CoA transferase
VPARLMACLDGYVSVALLPAYDEAFRTAFGIPAASDGGDLWAGDRREVLARVEMFFGRYFSKLPAAEVCASLQAAGIVCAQQQGLDAVLDDPQLEALDFYQTLSHGVLGRRRRLLHNGNLPFPAQTRRLGQC